MTNSREIIKTLSSKTQTTASVATTVTTTTPVTTIKPSPWKITLANSLVNANKTTVTPSINTMQAADEIWDVFSDFIHLPDGDIVYIATERYQKTWHHFLVKRNDSAIIAKWLIGTSYDNGLQGDIKIAPYLPGSSLIWVWQSFSPNDPPICLLMDGNTGKLITQLIQSSEIPLEISKISTLVDGKYIFITSFHHMSTNSFQVWKKNDDSFEFKKVYAELFANRFYDRRPCGYSHFLTITRDQKHCIAHHARTVYVIDISNREKPTMTRQFEVARSSAVLITPDEKQLLVAHKEETAITAWDISNITEPRSIITYILRIENSICALQFNFNYQFIFITVHGSDGADESKKPYSYSIFYAVPFDELHSWSWLSIFEENFRNKRTLFRRELYKRDLYRFTETPNGNICIGEQTYVPPTFYTEYREKYLTSPERRDVLSAVLFEYLNPKELINPILEYAGFSPSILWQKPEPQTATTSTTVTTTSTATATTSTAADHTIRKPRF